MRLDVKHGKLGEEEDGDDSDGLGIRENIPPQSFQTSLILG